MQVQVLGFKHVGKGFANSGSQYMLSASPAVAVGVSETPRLQQLGHSCALACLI